MRDLENHTRATLATNPHNQAALETLEKAYQQYRLELRRFFEFNSYDVQAVDDLIQALYLSIRKTRVTDDIRDPRQYVFRAAWNLLHSENRRIQAERAKVVSGDFEQSDARADPCNRLWIEDDTTAHLQDDEFNRVLAQLPPACQFAALRKYRDSFSHEQIAREMGVTVHAVKKYIRRALNEFRRHFNTQDLGAAQEGKRR